MNIRDYLKTKKLLCDGAFGTYFAAYSTETLPEKANTSDPDAVLNIHLEYIKSGAMLIRTNTFSANTKSLGCDIDELKKNLRSAYNIAKKAAQNKVYIACDIGPDSYDDYFTIADTFIDCGAEIILFETLAETDSILPVIFLICYKQPD